MKFIRRPLFRVLAAAVLALAAAPTWACVRSCSRGPETLACIKLCAHSKALLTRDGALPSVGAAACGVESVAAVPAVAAAAFELKAPAAMALAALLPVALPSAASRPEAAAVRGPPLPTVYLSYDHPFANGPPTLL